MENRNDRLMQVSCLLDRIAEDIADDGDVFSTLDCGYLRAAQSLVEDYIDSDYQPWIDEQEARPNRRLLKALGPPQARSLAVDPHDGITHD